MKKSLLFVGVGLVTFFLGLSGCYVAGESLVLIEGEINNETSKLYTCELLLLSGETELVSFNVEKDFRIDYTVEPTSREYVVEIFCVDDANEKVNLKREALQLGGKPSTQVDLGSMTINK